MTDAELPLSASFAAFRIVTRGCVGNAMADVTLVEGAVVTTSCDARKVHASVVTRLSPPSV
jgi:hypothetical protein